MADKFQSGLWSVEGLLLSINVRELLVVEKGLLAFCQIVQGHSVAVFHWMFRGLRPRFLLCLLRRYLRLKLPLMVVALCFRVLWLPTRLHVGRVLLSRRIRR